jgi:hypothetical protein
MKKIFKVLATRIRRLSSTICAIALVAVIGFSFVSCSDGGGGGTTPGDGGKPVNGIEITKLPSKTQYNIGEDLDLEGMVVTATYNDGTTEEVSGYKDSGYDKNKRGNQTITITYGGKSDTFTVNVLDPNLPVVAKPTANPMAITYNETPFIYLSTETEGAQIWYTTDGSNPTKNGAGSTKYTTPFTITPPVTVKALAVKDDMNDSAILEVSYTAPIVLAENTWADGNFTSSVREQWFKFTATADTQYVHVDFGTLTYLYVQVYYSNGYTVGEEASLYGSSNKYISRTLTTGQEYYIKVRPISSGTYRIGFTASATPPPVTLPTVGVTQLTLDTWANSKITASDAEQWFKFTSTADKQYVYVDSNIYLYIQVYDSNGSVVGDESSLQNGNISRTVTTGQEYYIRVRPSSSGSYWILFTTSATRPPVTLPAAGVTQLTVNKWADGNLPTSSDEQWFKFTATASTQYIHIDCGTLRDLYVQVYDSSGSAVGSENHFSSEYFSRTVTTGQEYYIRIRPYYSYYSSSGTYQIGFNTSTTAPPVTLPTTGVTQLTVNTWADGNFSTSSDVQWFKFTATASPQYIHINFGSLTTLSIRVYNSNGALVGSETNLSGSSRYISRTVTTGQECYIRISPSSSSGSGTYKIAFNTTFYSPGGVTQLTVNKWADGNIPTSSDVQWFKFTATASTQYIHANFGTLPWLYVQVCDSNGALVGSEDVLSRYSSGDKYISRTLTTEQEYYIRVRPYDSSSTPLSGTYQIGFTTSTTTPLVTLPTTGVTQLTVNKWADGNIPTSSDMQWFKFTATASTQYIHANFGTLTWVYIQVYNSNGALVGSEDYLFSLSSGDKYISRTVTNGQVYYIRVRPYPSDNGTYKIGFTTSSTAPN